MRTDAITDRKQVHCPNVRFGPYKARYDDLVVWQYPDTPGEHIGRVLCRIDFAPALEPDEQPIRNYLRVICIDVVLGSCYERWVDPLWIVRIRPSDEIAELAMFMQWVLGQEWKKYTPEKLIQWARSGFKTMEEWEQYQKRVAKWEQHNDGDE